NSTRGGACGTRTPRSSTPQREGGIEGRSPDKAEGRIRGNGRQSRILVRATSSFPGALRLPGLRRYTATGGACRTRTPRSSIPQRERGIEGVARIRPKAASGEWAPITDARARDILVPGCASLTRATQVPHARRRLQNPNPSLLDPPTGEGNRGGSPDKAEGRIRGVGANHGCSCARHPRSRVCFAYPGYAGTPRPVAPAEPEPSPLDPPTGEVNRGGSPDKAESRIRGNGAQPRILVRATSSFPGALRLPGLRSYTTTGGACRTRTPHSSIPPTGEGNRGGSPDKAEGRIRGMGATTDARARDILIPGFDRTQACL